MAASTDAILAYGVDLGAVGEDEIPAAIEAILSDEETRDDIAEVEFVEHCSASYSSWIVAVPGTVHRAYRGSPKIIDLGILASENRVVGPKPSGILDERVAAAVAWLRKHGVARQVPTWLLASWWG